MIEIIHQTQPTPTTCVCTCMAMILAVPAQEVIDELDDYYQEHVDGVQEYMLKRGVVLENRYCSGPDQHMELGFVYVIAVPSLNLLGEMHSCLLDLRTPNVHKVYDPNKGREGKRYYISRTDVARNENEIELRGFVVDFKVVHATSLGI